MNQAIRAFSEGFRGSFYLAAALIVSLVTTVITFSAVRNVAPRKRMLAIPPDPQEFCRAKDQS